MTIASPIRSLGAAVSAAIADVRRRAGDALAPVVVVTPMRANAQLVQRCLAAHGAYIRVHFEPAAELVAAIGREAVLGTARRTEPAGWLEAILHHALPELAAAGALGRHGATVSRPAWIPALAQAVVALEGAEVEPATLRAIRGEGLTDRAELLASLMERVAAERDREGLVGPGALARAARDAVADGRLPSPWGGAGFVVLGDGALPHGVHGALRAVFTARPTTRLALPPFEPLAPAPSGLRSACRAAPVVAVAPRADGSLGHLQSDLFGVGGTATDGEDDDGVCFAATPDEVRETTEAVRVIQAAIDARTPLDRLAIAVPDNATADLLGEALERAMIPATMLVGPPLSRSAEARFLSLLLAIAGGEELAVHWYEVVRHPGVRGGLQRHDVDVFGAGRWRRLLASCGASRGTARIVAAVRAPARRDDHEEDPERGADDERAAASLAAAIEALAATLAALPVKAPLGAHARAWRGLLRDLPRSLLRGQLERLLDGLGAGDVGPELRQSEARAILAGALESSQVLRGALQERAVRVAPPMALLGGDFDLVCVLGLNEGRFPRQAREDALLTDALTEAIAAIQGERRLPPAEHLRDADRRRFAAAVGATGGRLWLSLPQSDLMSARPAVPSSLALEALTALTGERATFGALRHRAVRVGGRDRFAPDAPAAAVSLIEHLIARLAAEEAGLAGLSGHRWAGRLLTLYRSIDRLYTPRDGEAPAIDGWSGHVPPALLPHPARGDGGPMEPRILAQAVATPAAYFFTHGLGAWRAKWFKPASDPAGRWNVARWAREALVAALDAEAEGPDAAIDAALDDLAAGAATHGDAEDAGRVGIARVLARARCDALRAHWDPLAPGPRDTLVGAPLADDVPWRLSGTTGYVGGGTLVDYDAETQPTKRRPAKFVRLELEALALARAGVAVDTPELRGVDGTKDRPKGWSVAAAEETARAAWRRVDAGVWPAEDSTFALHRERALGEVERQALVSASRDGGEV